MFFINAEKRQKKVCMHTISNPNSWNLTKLAQIHHQNGGGGGGGGGWGGGGHYIINTQKGA